MGHHMESIKKIEVNQMASGICQYLIRTKKCGWFVSYLHFDKDIGFHVLFESRFGNTFDKQSEILEAYELRQNFD
jgi:hypothetical protein